MQLLRTQARSSARTVSTFTHRATSQIINSHCKNLDKDLADSEEGDTVSTEKTSIGG